MFSLDVPEFAPHRLLKNGHVQTVAATVFSGVQTTPISHTTPLTLPDGDQLALHCAEPLGSAACRRETRQVLLLHGLGGCHASPYMVRTTRRLVESGFACWRLDARGCGAGMELARQHHHAGRTRDLQAAVGHITRQRAQAPLTVIGFSLGGNLLLSSLAEWGAKMPQLDSAIAVAPPVDLWRCARNLQSGLNRGYDIFFANLLRKRYVQRRKRVPNLMDRSVPQMPDSLYAFDQQLTAPLGGFASAREYYERCSAGPKLSQVSTPTLMVIDKHDPVIPFEIFDDVRTHAKTVLYTTRFGGHLGYISDGSVDPDRRWLDWRIRDWVSRLPQTRINA